MKHNKLDLAAILAVAAIVGYAIAVLVAAIGFAGCGFER